MCSIFGILDIKSNPSELRETALAMSKQMRHRGPDWSGIFACDNAILAHERLAIVGIESGAQPIYSADGNLVLAVNGEIYNHKALRRKLADHYDFQTSSDCEVILALYQWLKNTAPAGQLQERFSEILEALNGIFAFILYDRSTNKYLIGRDHIGIIPLYQGHDQYGNYYIASEMKALVPVCNTISEFAPGSFLSSDHSEPQRYYQRDWQNFAEVKDRTTDKAKLKQALEAAVKRQLMTDVPYGVLLSGGLDSSIISAITKQYAALRIENDDKSAAWWPQLHSFAIGLPGAPDLSAARKVAEHLGTVHHELTYTVQEGLDALRDVIYHIETYDITTIRASTPMFLMGRKIKAMGIKMVLSGEGADEIFGGYLYFHKAPNAAEFHDETVRKLLALNQFDCARANKSLAAWGVEGRVPFLDKEFIDVAMRLDPQDKMCGNGKIEKQLLRECFADLLPHEVAWRQKEQFSDGVGYGWIDALKALAEEKVSDQQMENARFRFAHNTPLTKEGYMYREIFDELFPLASAAQCVPGGPSIACSSAKAIEWDESFKNCADPSGRAVNAVHNDGYKK
ncbi:MAG: asparagine synthase B [Vibrionaceae bacterium]